MVKYLSIYTPHTHNNTHKVVFVHEGIKVEHTDSKSIAAKSASKLLDECKSTAKRQLTKDDADAITILESLSDCVRKGIADEIERANEEIVFQAKIRKEIADSWENYTCADETVNATEPKSETKWRQRDVGIMLDRPASKIHVIEDFLTAEECKAVEEMATPHLHDAQVADGSGGGELSDNRKAKQAAIAVNWDKEKDGDLIARLSRRVYDYVNHVLPFDIKENGQESLMSIQYFGRGPEDETPDRYMHTVMENVPA